MINALGTAGPGPTALEGDRSVGDFWCYHALRCLNRAATMKLRLRHFFAATTVAAVWTWAILHWEFPSARWAAATFTLLTVFGSSWMTGAALFASLASLIEFQTCACGHLSTWNALPVTGASCLLAGGESATLRQAASPVPWFRFASRYLPHPFCSKTWKTCT